MRWAAIIPTKGGWCRGRRPWEVVVLVGGIGGKSSIRRIVLVGMGGGITSRGKEGKRRMKRDMKEGNNTHIETNFLLGFKDVIES